MRYLLWLEIRDDWLAPNDVRYLEYGQHHQHCSFEAETYLDSPIEEFKVGRVRPLLSISILPIHHCATITESIGRAKNLHHTHFDP